MALYQVGDIVEGTVTGISEYGAFIHLLQNYNGLIHISEISNHYVKSILDYLSIGEDILCEVLEVDETTKQVKLSIKNINYKLIPRYGKIKDTKNGFKPLQMKLPIWMRELKEINENKREE